MTLLLLHIRLFFCFLVHYSRKVRVLYKFLGMKKVVFHGNEFLKVQKLLERGFNP